MNRDFMASMIDGYAENDLDEGTVQYLDNYWIDRDRFSQDWSHLIQSTFRRSSGKVSVVEGCAVDFLQGGILFAKDEFLAFLDQARATGATRFAVIEDIGLPDWGNPQEFNFFRFSYPTNVDWDEMAHSSILAQDIFERPIRCYFVVTDNGKIGKYANNDADSPYDLIFHK